MSKTTHLQGIGSVPAIPARDLKPGDVVRWNYGYTSDVLKVTPSKTGKTVDVLLHSHDSGKVSSRKLGADRLVAVSAQ